MIKNISKYRLILINISILLAILVTPNPTFGQVKRDEMLNITPIIFNFELEKGQEQIEKLKIENKLNVPMGVRLSLEVIELADEETLLKFSNNKEEDFISWVELSEKELVIEENGTETIDVKIKTPENAKDGSYNAVLFITPFSSQPISRLSPTVLTRIGSLIFANVGQPKNLPSNEMARILNFDFARDGKNLELNFRVKNEFNFTFSAKPSMSIKNASGKEININLDERKVLPQRTRKWTNQLNLNYGIYKLEAKVLLGQGKYITQSKFLFHLPFKSSHLIILIIAVALILIRKRLINSIKVLLGAK